MMKTLLLTLALAALVLVACGKGSDQTADPSTNKLPASITNVSKISADNAEKVADEILAEIEKL